MYRSDRDDTTYLSNYFNYNDESKEDGSYSISLLASHLPVDIKQILDDIDNRFNSDNVEFQEIKEELKR